MTKTKVWGRWTLSGLLCLLALTMLGGAGVSQTTEATAPGPETTRGSFTGRVLWRGRPAAHAVVVLEPLDGAPGAVSGDTVLVDQRHLRFQPTILAIPKGTVIEFRNSDEIMHNVFSPQRRGADFDLGTYPINESRTHRFDVAGQFVVLCHVHPEMAAWVVVAEAGYPTVSNELGEFTLSEVPAGRYTVRGWYRRREGTTQEVTIGEDGVTLELELVR